MLFVIHLQNKRRSYFPCWNFQSWWFLGQFHVVHCPKTIWLNAAWKCLYSGSAGPVRIEHIPKWPRNKSFVGTDIWKLWELLGVGHAWLWQPVHQWSRSNDYNVAKQFVWGLTVVNDGAERCVCTITDFVQATSDSIYQEDILLIGNSHWEVFQDLQKAAFARLNP